ncbi:MAG: Uma2 family endonuclease [Chloroflexi bacterium]|nr:Uma2 family endonuclease [Chloroflexota bacterium]
MTITLLGNEPDASTGRSPLGDAPDVGLFPVKLRLPEGVVSAGPDACIDWFWEVCFANDDHPWQMELTADGVLEIMPPTDEPSDVHENRTSSKVYLWDEQQGFLGAPTGPTAAYRLPNGALRVPDAAWTARENVRSRQAGEPRGRPYCPDFVVEIRSSSQRSLPPLLRKMQEYMDNGVKLGWLIDPLERTVRIYRAGVAEPEILDDPQALDGEGVLPGFTFAVRELIFDLV